VSTAEFCGSFDGAGIGLGRWVVVPAYRESNGWELAASGGCRAVGEAGRDRRFLAGGVWMWQGASARANHRVMTPGRIAGKTHVSR